MYYPKTIGLRFRVGDTEHMIVEPVNDSHTEKFAPIAINEKTLIPPIVDVIVYNDSNDEPVAMRMIFADESETKATVCKGDKFDFEQGLSICVMKRALDTITGGNGGKVYNKLGEIAAKSWLNIREAKNIAKAEAEHAEEKRKRNHAKKLARIARREKREREEQIEIQKEAFVRALREVGYNGSADFESVNSKVNKK